MTDDPFPVKRGPATPMPDADTRRRIAAASRRISHELITSTAGVTLFPQMFAALTESGRTDWKLPSREEMFYVIGGGAALPDEVSTTLLWTRTGLGDEANSPLGLRLFAEYPTPIGRALNLRDLAHVRCVR